MKLQIIDFLTTFAVGAFIFFLTGICFLGVISGFLVADANILTAFFTTCNVFATVFLIHHIGDKYVCYYLGYEEEEENDK